jgi:hypothetical protein
MAPTCLERNHKLSKDLCDHNSPKSITRQNESRIHSVQSTTQSLLEEKKNMEMQNTWQPSKSDETLFDTWQQSDAGNMIALAHQRRHTQQPKSQKSIAV